MLVFLRRRAIRRNVLVMLAAWVFALVAGVANACLLHDGQPQHNAQVQAVERDAPDARDATCNEAWDGAALTVAKQEGHDSLDFDAAALHAGAGGPQRVPAVAMEQAGDGGLQAHGPPDAIRFLRLRL